jgi:radical SAM protein with 4Fe4S-binding SPASM domain
MVYWFMTTLQNLLQQYQSEFDIIDVINLDDWYSLANYERPHWLRTKVESVYRSVYEQNQRIIFTLTQGDEYLDKNDNIGIILKTLQELLNQIDVSNFFVVILTNNTLFMQEAKIHLGNYSTDPIPLTLDYFDSQNNDAVKKISDQKSNVGYNYNSVRPLKINIEDLTSQQQHLLLDSKQFCIYPWIHMYVEPSGRVFPCCGSIYKDSGVLGNTNQASLNEIWNSDRMRELRNNMLNDRPTKGCNRCYEQEQSGFFSMRNSANKHHGHHINLVDATKPDGTVDKFSMMYWDVRFSNLCNLKCRSCGPSFSSSWYADQLKLAPDYAKDHKALIFAGKYETDLWEQLIEHIDHVEQIYFAGGEPIMMDEHYRILEELERRGKFNVRLIYNTNFTQIKLKDRTVFDYWKKFDSVSVGASLDDSHARGEYIRKGTKWQDVEDNRRLMMEICPNVDFYISATLGILNAWHLPDFHQDWTNRGLIQAKDFNINIVTDPEFYRMDIAPLKYKQELQTKYQQHLAWLTPQDHLRRASNGYQSAIKFMMSTDNSHLLDTFWAKTNQLDSIRNENWFDIVPELQALKINHNESTTR